MLTWVTDESGDTLAGALDGHNRAFRTLQAMRLDRVVDVYVNGQLRVADLANGYVLQDPWTVQLREAPVPEDTVAVAYCTDPVVPGVRGGTPAGLTAQVLRPLALRAQVLDRPAALRAHLSTRPQCGRRR